MAKGRKKTPTEILSRRGSKQAKGRRDGGSTPCHFPCPEKADERLRVSWERLEPMLYNAGLLTAKDGESLEKLCRLDARCRELEDSIVRDKTPQLINIFNGRGQLVDVIAPKVQRELTQRLSSLFVAYREFGLTPASRPNVEPISMTEKTGIAKLT